MKAKRNRGKGNRDLINVRGKEKMVTKLREKNKRFLALFETMQSCFS